jgi:LmbE family N-acetylglucosaminyl deacetylase
VARARLRRREQLAALAKAGVGAERVVHLGVAELEACDQLAGLVNRLALLLRGLRPQLVLTHPYEGGHPDHDAAAFVLRAVVERLASEDGHAPCLAEMLGYHRAGDRLVGDRFLPAPTDRWTVTLRLSPRERRLRREMLACFAEGPPGHPRFGARAEERFRPAPSYDFRRAPHDGPLGYELLGLPLDGATWRRRAAAAHRELAA